MHLSHEQLTPEEQKAVVEAFKNPAAAQANGVKLGGTKFFVLQANDRSIYGKKAVRSCFQSHHAYYFPSP
jgi:profilin